MSKSITSGAFSPHIGIEHVFRSGDGPGVTALPDSTKVVPTDAMTSMESLHDLYASSWDKSMQRFLRPHIDARELLIQGVLAGRIRQARAELLELARKKKSKALRSAAVLLEEDEEMKELLDIYKNLLLQG